MNGNQLKIEIKKTDTVAKLKELIQDKEGIPPDQQYLICDGKKLKDSSKTIEQYEISEGAKCYIEGGLHTNNWKGGRRFRTRRTKHTKNSRQRTRRSR